MYEEQGCAYYQKNNNNQPIFVRTGDFLGSTVFKVGHKEAHEKEFCKNFTKLIILL